MIDLDDSVELSFEDRVQIYWLENRSFIYGCITLLLIILVGYQSLRILKNHRATELQDAYIEATESTEMLAEFAQGNSDTKLGGFAALLAGDSAYSDGDYELAVKYYDLAAESLADNFLSGRAQIGSAFAHFYSGLEEEAIGKLKMISANNALPETIRTEAAYHLAVNA